MNVEVNDNGVIEFREVFNPIKLITRDGETLVIAMRDKGFEFTYLEDYYEAKEGVVNKVSDNNLDITLAQAVGRLVEELNKDKSEGSYYYSWQANIAMAFYDIYNFEERRYNSVCHTSDELHKLSNKAAKRFLEQLTYQSE